MYLLDLLTFINTLRPKQNGHHFLDDVFKCILVNENIWICIQISQNFVPKFPFNNVPASVHSLMSKSLLIFFFQICLLIVGQHNRQQIRRYIQKYYPVHDGISLVTQTVVI